MTATNIVKLLISSIVAALLSSCATTPYADRQPASLTDLQIVEELDACAAGVNSSIDRTQYLLATTPEPAYVLTSSTTTFQALSHSNISAYSMPTGYGSRLAGIVSTSTHGTAYTNYQYTDANSLARGMHGLALAIAKSNARSYRARCSEILTEIDNRIATRKQRVQTTINRFFQDNPSPQRKRNLIAAILPWVAAESPNLSDRELLDSAKSIAISLNSGDNLDGEWYGLFSQTTTLTSGQTVSFNQYVRMSFQQTGRTVVGKGEIGSGEVLLFEGTRVGQTLEGIIVNETSAINSTVSGIVSEKQIVSQFEGIGAGMTLKGTAVLLR